MGGGWELTARPFSRPRIRKTSKTFATLPLTSICKTFSISDRSVDVALYEQFPCENERLNARLSLNFRQRCAWIAEPLLSSESSPVTTVYCCTIPSRQRLHQLFIYTNLLYFEMSICGAIRSLRCFKKSKWRRFSPPQWFLGKVGALCRNFRNLKRGTLEESYGISEAND